MFSFAWPWMILLLALPLAVRIFEARWGKAAAPKAPEIFFPHIDSLAAAFPQWQREKPSRLYFLTLTLLWLCLTVALMGPQFVDQSAPLQPSGRDLMLAVDLSGSMQTADYAKDNHPISRMEIVKSVVSDFVRQRQGDRVGLVLFGSNAYLHVPLTLDTNSVRKMLDNTQAGEAGDQTAIGDAIGMAVKNLRDRPEKSRVVVLLTDGVDNASTIPPLVAANLARQYAIRVYTIGVGSRDAAPALRQNGKDAPAPTNLDDDLLQKIASMTGGSYYRAGDAAALRSIYAQINTLEKTRAESRSVLIREPLYRYPLGGAMALLLLLLLSLFRKTRPV